MSLFPTIRSSALRFGTGYAIEHMDILENNGGIFKTREEITDSKIKFQSALLYLGGAFLCFLPFVPFKVRFVPNPVDTGNSIGYYLPEKLREALKTEGK